MKNKRALQLMAAMAIASSFAAGARGQGLLDQQLGPTPAPTQPPAQPAHPAGNPTAAPAAQPPAQGDIISPDAVKRVDDNELIKDLIKPGTDQLDPGKVNEQKQALLERMMASGERLAEKDPGEVTQETQRRIVMDLDVMIEIARRQQQQQSSSSQQQQQQQPGQRPQPGQANGSQQNGGTNAANGDPLPRGGISDGGGNDVRGRDPASWGGLPPRDREQISNGAKEEQVSSYRAMIEKYYQALSEMGSTRRQ